MTLVALTCACGAELAGDVVGSASLSCSSCGASFLVGCSQLVAGVPALGVVFLHGRGVEHDELADGRTACGLELVDVQLVLAGGRRCRWCAIALGRAA